MAYKNMKNVTENTLNAAPVDDKYEYVVLSAPTVDITNMNTSRTKPSENLEAFKHEIVESCKNTYATAEKALASHPELKKVIILEHPPRYDTPEQDPLSLKSEFAKYANNIYHQLWFESKLKHKIALGQHKLECSEETRLKRFRYLWKK